jgi:pantoate--beta-alanine ligase
MYPDGFATKIVPGGPALAGLEDKFRPHFFGGVCTVVAKLLLQVTPQFATFGEKDYQQLKVVTAMTRDLGIPTKIIGLPTVREKDGLAMSSRNAYLSADERTVAPTLYRVLRECARRLNAGSPLAATLTEGEEQIAHAGFAVDYFEARHAGTLAPIASRKASPVRLLVAAKLGRTRLIDNIGV